MTEWRSDRIPSDEEAALIPPMVETDDLADLDPVALGEEDEIDEDGDDLDDDEIEGTED